MSASVQRQSLTKATQQLHYLTNACLILTRLSVALIKVDCWWKKKKTFCGQKAFIFFPFCACFCEECVSNSFTRAVSFFLFCQPDNWHWKGELNLWRRALVSLGLSACQRNTTAPRLSNPFHEIFKEMGSINQNDSSLWRFINGASSHRVVSVGLKSCLNRIIQNTYTTEGTLG